MFSLLDSIDFPKTHDLSLEQDDETFEKRMNDIRSIKASSFKHGKANAVVSGPSSFFSSLSFVTEVSIL